MAIDTTTPTSRRALLAGTVGGLAALAAQALGGPRPASAHDPDDVRLGSSNVATSATLIQNTATDASAAFGTAAGTGVWGDSVTGTGVQGHSNSGTGVDGFSGGVGKTSIHGVKGNAGTAVHGEITFAASTDGAVVGTTNATGGPGVRGVNSANGRGLWGKAQGSGEGVYGESTNGVGGLFTGGKAQLKLAPKATAGRPTSGAHTKGEIYMDSKGALFVCTVNGTPGTWRKVTTTAT
jgi:hypothetical protein